MAESIATSMYQRFKWTAIGRDRIAIQKRYEPIQPYILLGLARTVEADTFIDIGANIGVYSIFMSSLECVREVHSFEPSPQTFDELTNNITLNAISKRKTYKNALFFSSLRALDKIAGKLRNQDFTLMVNLLPDAHQVSR